MTPHYILKSKRNKQSPPIVKSFEIIGSPVAIEHSIHLIYFDRNFLHRIADNKCELLTTPGFPLQTFELQNQYALF